MNAALLTLRNIFIYGWIYRCLHTQEAQLSGLSQREIIYNVRDYVTTWLHRDHKQVMSSRRHRQVHSLKKKKKKETKTAFEQEDSSCWNSRNSKRSQGEVMASSSPQVPHWILSSLGELCTQWPNKCDRHLPGFKPPHLKWRAPSHPQLRYRRYVMAPHISYPFPPSRETRGCARRKPCVSSRRLEQVGGETNHPRGEVRVAEKRVDSRVRREPVTFISELFIRSPESTVLSGI